jgi:hypothetical protein
MHQLVHIWKFDDDAERRAYGATVFANPDCMEGFAAHFRPLVLSHEVKLLTAASWGPPPEGARPAHTLPVQRVRSIGGPVLTRWRIQVTFRQARLTSHY